MVYLNRDNGKKMCIITDIESNLGFNTYELLDLDSPDSAIIRHASRHELEEIRSGDLDLDLAFEPKMKELPTASYPATKPAPSSSRFVRVSPDCLDQLAEERLSTNTIAQTKWSLKVFRGKYGPYHIYKSSKSSCG